MKHFAIHLFWNELFVNIYLNLINCISHYFTFFFLLQFFIVFWSHALFCLKLLIAKYLFCNIFILKWIILNFFPFESIKDLHSLQYTFISQKIIIFLKKYYTIIFFAIEHFEIIYDFYITFWVMFYVIPSLQ